MRIRMYVMYVYEYVCVRVSMYVCVYRTMGRWDDGC